MQLKRWLVLLVICLFSINSHAQLWDDEYNRLGLKAGANYFNIITQDLPLTPKASWTAGFTTRSTFRRNFQWIYGLQFYDFQATITGEQKLDHSQPYEQIPFNMIGVQASFLGSYKILGDHLSVEVGPVIQVNGKFEPQQNMELYYIKGYSFQSQDMQNLSTFNFNLAFGISGGVEKVKLWAQYQIGLNNILSGLNKENLEEKDPIAKNFEGRLSMLTAGIVVFL